MTLGELKQELLQLGIRQVGVLRRPATATEPETNTIVFSADQKIVVPFALKTVYFLVLDSSDESAVVHSEKYKSLMRTIEKDR
jgi:hypothetical protein